MNRTKGRRGKGGGVGRYARNHGARGGNPGTKYPKKLCHKIQLNGLKKGVNYEIKIGN
jgi:hypothetical protein